MNEIEQRCFDILATAEQVNATMQQQQATIDKQQKLIEMLAGNYAKLDKKLIDTVNSQISEQTAFVVSKEVARGLNSGVSKIEKEVSFNAKEFNDNLKFQTKELTNVINKTQNRLDYQKIIIWGGSVAIVCLTMLIVMFLYVPSVDELKSRRAEVAELDRKNLVASNCDGKVCVKIKKNKCGYGDDGAYCIAETK